MVEVSKLAMPVGTAAVDQLAPVLKTFDPGAASQVASWARAASGREAEAGQRQGGPARRHPNPLNALLHRQTPRPCIPEVYGAPISQSCVGVVPK